MGRKASVWTFQAPNERRLTRDLKRETESLFMEIQKNAIRTMSK